MASGHELASVSPAGGTGLDELDPKPPQLVKAIIKAKALAALRKVIEMKSAFSATERT
jgi:hypothetical protein